MLDAGLPYPLVIEAREQLTFAESDGLLEPSRVDETGELARIHPHVAPEGDLVARGHQLFDGRAERTPQRPGRGAQALSRAGIQHIGPEARRDVAAAMLAGVQRQVG